MRTILLVALLLMGPSQLLGQTLYLIAGNADRGLMSGYDVLLLQPDGEGGVRIAEEIVTSKYPIDWIAVSTQLRKAVVVAGQQFVLDLDRAAIVKTCKFPPLRNVSRVGQWLLELPGLGPTFTIQIAGDTDAQRAYWSMSLDPATPCAESFFETPPGDMRYALVTGTHGVYRPGSVDLQSAYIEDDGAVVQRAPLAPLGHRVPAWVRTRFATPFAMIMINTRELFAMTATPPPGPPPKEQQNGLVVQRKRDQKWLWLPLRPNQSRTYLRGFESYLVRIEALWRPEAHASSVIVKGVLPPGVQWWRKEPARTGPAFNPGVEILSKELSFPGQVHIHDIENDHQYTITTNEPDTEVILVSGHTAYYRVNDKLFEVEPRNGILGKPKLIAQDDLIGDAHWAFLK